MLYDILGIKFHEHRIVMNDFLNEIKSSIFQNINSRKSLIGLLSYRLNYAEKYDFTDVIISDFKDLFEYEVKYIDLVNIKNKE